MSFSRVAIIGLGLLGGSIGLAVAESVPGCTTTGYDADPDVRRDLEAYIGRLVPDGDPRYLHDAEGPDDMAAHIRSVLTLTSISIPVARGRADLGTWQGVYLWEHRYANPERRLTVTILGATR